VILSFSNPVTLGVTANSPEVILTFATPLSSGDIVEVVAVVDRPGTGIYTAHNTVVSAAATDIGNSVELIVLGEPRLVVHTRGTKLADPASDFGPQPFVRDPALEPKAIGLEGQTGIRSALLDVPLLANSLASLPIGPGRVVTKTTLADAVFEGPRLSAVCDHRNLVVMLASTNGRVVLVVLESSRSDARTLVSGATVTVYDLTGRPIISPAV
jgi:hypothetical protein